MTFIKTVFLFTWLFLFSGFAQAENIKHGNWEMTFKVSIKGLPMELPTQTHTSEQCLTKENEIPKSDDNKDCNFKMLERTDSKYSWEMKCKDSGMSGKGEMNFKGETMQGYFNAKGSMQGMNMEMNSEITGKYLGKCK